MTDDDVETLMKECCDSEDEDGCIPYESSIFAYLKILSDWPLESTIFPNSYTLNTKV